MTVMAGYQALQAAGVSIVALLNRRFGERDGGAGLAAILANTRQLKTMANNNGQLIQQPAISVFCYRVSVNRETRPGWSAVTNADGIPRIPLQLHFLLGAFAATVEEELLWLGLAAQVLESEGILTGPLLLPVTLGGGGAVNPWLPGDMVQVVTDDLAMDSMSEAFQALSTDYRLQLPYLARVIVIDGEPQPVGPGSPPWPDASTGRRHEHRHHRDQHRPGAGAAPPGTRPHRPRRGHRPRHHRAAPGRLGSRGPSVAARARGLVALRRLRGGGGGRFRLRATPRRPDLLTVRLYDVSRRYVPRRLGVTLWPYSALVDPVPANLIAVAARTLPIWLFPGAAYPVSPGMTAVRGRVTRRACRCRGHASTPWTGAGRSSDARTATTAASS